MTETELAAVIRGIAPVVRELITAAVSASDMRTAILEAQLKALGDVRDRVVTLETKAAQPLPPVPSVPDLTPVLERLAVMETKVAIPAPSVQPAVDNSDLRERLVTLETRAAGPSLTDMAVVDLRTRQSALEARLLDDTLAKSLAAVSERLAIVETRAPVPGPTGKDGVHGKDGVDGLGFEDMDEVLEDDGRTVKRRYMKGDRVKEFVHKTAAEIWRGVYLEGKTYERGDGVTWGGSEWHCNETTTTKPGEGLKAWTLKVKRGRDGKDGKDGADGKPGRDLTKETAAWRS